MEQREYTYLIDRKGVKIFVGDKVKFKFYGNHFFEQVVEKHRNGFYPFYDLAVEKGFSINAKDCEVIKR